MFGPIRAVAIDDNPSHLLAITTALSASGIPCAGLKYSRGTGELMPKPKEGGFPFLRIVFMDLNLDELPGVPDSPTLAGPVIEVLRQIVPAAGPYILVFWTRIGSKVTEVRNILFQRLPTEEIPCPADILEIGKGPFEISPPKGKDFEESFHSFHDLLAERLGDLVAEVKRVSETNLQLGAMAAWEQRASVAAAKSINELYSYARMDADSPAQASISAAKILAAIANAAVGSKSASESPNRALDAGMVDVLTDQLGTSVDAAGYQELIMDAIGEALARDNPFNDDITIKAGLNTFFHIDTQVSNSKTFDRGAVFSARKPLNTSHLGFGPEMLDSEFLIPPEKFEQQEDQVRQINKDFRIQGNIVLVELGADCDHAQDHDRTRRFLLGLEVPAEQVEFIKFPGNGKLRNESLQMMGPWLIGGKATYLLVSCRRYWTLQKPKMPIDGVSVRYRLRASVVDKLLHHYSTWASRPGIIEFQPKANSVANKPAPSEQEN